MTASAKEAKAMRWRKALIKDRTDAFAVAIHFVAERYSDPAHDLLTLIFDPDTSHYVYHTFGDPKARVVKEEMWLHDEIVEFIEDNKGRWSRRVEPWTVFHLLRGICGEYITNDTLTKIQWE